MRPQKKRVNSPLLNLIDKINYEGHLQDMWASARVMVTDLYEEWLSKNGRWWQPRKAVEWAVLRALEGEFVEVGACSEIIKEN